MLVLSHDGRRAYTANVGPGTVSVIDLQARKVLKVIPISGNTQRISISPDDKWVFTADQTKPQMAVIDTATEHSRQVDSDGRHRLRLARPRPMATGSSLRCPIRTRSPSSI